MSVQSRLASSADVGSCMACAVPDPTRSQDVVVFSVGTFTLRLCTAHARALKVGVERNLAAAYRRLG